MRRLASRPPCWLWRVLRAGWGLPVCCPPLPPLPAPALASGQSAGAHQVEDGLVVLVDVLHRQQPVGWGAAGNLRFRVVRCVVDPCYCPGRLLCLVPADNPDAVASCDPKPEAHLTMWLLSLSILRRETSRRVVDGTPSSSICACLWWVANTCLVTSCRSLSCPADRRDHRCEPHSAQQLADCSLSPPAPGPPPGASSSAPPACP